MKKSILGIILFYLLQIPALFAQVENVVVETYYVSDSLDATDTTGGFLAIGSKTYRIFVDLAPGVKLRKIYGDQNHRLRFTSTDFIFNNRADGLTFAKDFNKSRLGENTVALDSWLTIGQTTRIASKTYFGVLKSEDVSGSFIGGINNDGGSAAVSGGLLTNSDPVAEIPLTSSDGMDTMSIYPTSWADYGIINDTSGVDSTIFGSAKMGTEFISNNASLQNSGVTGVNPDSNKVLVAQITTLGELSFELNIEVEVPAFPRPVIVKYVASLANGESNSDTLKLSPYLKYPASCGCTDPNYLEYQAGYTCNIPDSCHTRIVFGCMDSLACNYDPAANFNLPGLCCYPGSCSDRDIGVVCPSLNLGRSSDPSLSIYPNPVSKEFELQFTVERQSEYSYSIYNSVGKMVLSRNLGNIVGKFAEEIDMSSFNSGLYFIMLTGGDKISSAKILKNKN